jgi:hypothetical protein
MEQSLEEFEKLGFSITKGNFKINYKRWVIYFFNIQEIIHQMEIQEIT